MEAQNSSASWFENWQTDAGWHFRPKRGAARRLAYFHAGCLTILAAVLLVPLLAGVVGFSISLVFVNRLPEDWVRILIFIGCGMALIGSVGLLAIFAGHVFRKSLRDNWLTLSVATGGPVSLGEKVLVEAGRAREVMVRTETKSDGEGGSVTYYFVEVEQHFESATPVAIPIPTRVLGWWDETPSNKQQSHEFARVLALALGVAGPK